MNTEGNFKMSEEEVRLLEETVNTPGWEVIKRINKRMTEDWMEQTAFTDFSTKTDEELARSLRFRQGMIKGMMSLILYIEKRIVQKK